MAVSTQHALVERKWNLLAWVALKSPGTGLASGLTGSVVRNLPSSSIPLLRHAFQAGALCGLTRWLPAALDAQPVWVSLEDLSWSTNPSLNLKVGDRLLCDGPGWKHVAATGPEVGVDLI